MGALDMEIPRWFAPVLVQIVGFIKCLELKAVVLALHHWAPMLHGHHVMVATDNTVVSSISKQGDTFPVTALCSGPIPVASITGHSSCREPREFNHFLQAGWNQRKSVKTNGLFPSKGELVDVFLEGMNQRLWLIKLNNLLKSY